MLSALADWIFGCSHRHTSFPITVRNGAGGRGRSRYVETYVVCLECGKHFAYDWAKMQIAREQAPLQRLVHHT